MNSAILTRSYGIGDTPTFGALVITSNISSLSLITLELPWRDDAPGASCVPEGSYLCYRHSTAAHPNVWQLYAPALGVYLLPNTVPPSILNSKYPIRSEVLIHNGNFARDSLGCILVGQSQGTLEGEPAILSSVAALSELMAFTSNWQDGWTLEITHA